MSRRWFGRDDKDLQEEVRAHIEIATRENMECGMRPEEARRAASRAFGNAGVTREQVQEGRPLYWLETLVQDARFGLRQMRRSPLISCAVLITLAAGIGVNAGAFSMILGKLFQVNVADPGSFASVEIVYSGEGARGTLPSRATYTDFLAFRTGDGVLGELAAWSTTFVSLDENNPARVRANQVSCNYFKVYGPARAILGRLLFEDECRKPGESPVAILSEELWRDRFASDAAILGKVIQLNREAFTIVGVASLPPGEHTPARIWVPYTMAPQLVRRQDLFAPAGPTWLNLSGRLRAGNSRAEAQAALRVAAAQQDRLYPRRTMTIHVTNGSDFERPGIAAQTFWPITLIMGSLTLILLMICVNASMLLLARAAARRREVAIRLSLGAGRRRLLRMLLTEGLTLAVIAAAAAGWIAMQVPAALSSLFKAGSHRAVTDWRLFAYLGMTALAAGCAAGLSPALESLKTDLATSLKGQEKPPGGIAWTVRDLLVAAQIALSLVLLIAGGLMLRAMQRMVTADPGFETRQVLVVWSPVRMPPYTRESASIFYRTLGDRVRALPGVESIGFATSVYSGNPVEVSLPAEAGKGMRLVTENDVSPDFFVTLGIPIVRGRGFTDPDTATAKPATCIVSENLARSFWPGSDPLGKRIEDKSGNLLEIIGVVRDTRSSFLLHGGDAQLYRPRRPQSDDDDLLIRFSGDPAPIAAAVRAVIRQMDTEMSPASQTLQSIVDGAAGKVRPLAGIVTVVGLAAVALVATGIFGVVAFAVTQRSRELAVRIALGAKGGDIVRLVLLTGSKPVMAGMAIGLPLAMACSQVLAKAFRNGDFRIQAADPVTYVAVALLLAVVSGAAMLGPACRAAASDPLAALRQD